jgi:phospholipid/cholesterol/gamma-HCH transport system substrate-binding protein
MEIAEHLHPLVRTDSVASIETEGLVGGNFLGIAAGSEAAPAAPPGSTIRSREPFEISDLLQQMSEAVGRVTSTIDLLRDDVLHAVQSIGSTVDNANDVIEAVKGDVKTLASAGARISTDAADIADSIRKGRGTIGKLVNDDELYRQASAVAKEAQSIAGDARRVMDQARQALENLQSMNGPVEGMTSSLRQTLDDARVAMAGFADNMQALKHNILFRGFFKTRGYFDLAKLSPADYRKGVLAPKGVRHPVRVWLESLALFGADAETGDERLTEDGKRRLDEAIAPHLDRLANTVLMIEGYSQAPARDEQYLRSRARAAMARDYLVSRFHLDPEAVGVMPLGHESDGSPDGRPWEGIALAVFLAKS